MKKQWNQLCQNWVWELEATDINCERDPRKTEGTIALLISTPEQEAPLRVDVKWM